MKVQTSQALVVKLDKKNNSKIYYDLCLVKGKRQYKKKIIIQTP